MNVTARDLVNAAHGSLLSGDPRASFHHVSIDTRTLKPGDLFVALRGPRFDGHRFLVQAIDKGTQGIVVEALEENVPWISLPLPAIIQVPNTLVALQEVARYVRRQSSATVIGITGSNGKTTTKEMLHAILKRVGKCLATRGNLNNHIGLPLTLSELAPDHRFAVLEMGASLDGDIALLADIARPQVGLITNIGKTHLAYLKSPQGVFQAKRALFDALPPDGLAIINQEDPFLSPLLQSLPCRKISFGLTERADVSADQIREDTGQQHFSLKLQGKHYPVSLAVSGGFQVMNALGAAAVARGLGISAEHIVAGLEQFTPLAMRMQVVSHPNGTLLINDAYNANPTSVRGSIASFCESYPGRRHWVVLGDMRELGEQAAPEHRELGKWLAVQPVDRILLYGRDCRFVLDGFRSIGLNAPPVERFRKKRLLMAELERALPFKPVILFKASRAMKLEDVVTSLLKK